MFLSKDDFLRAMRSPDVRSTLHGFAQDPDAPLPPSLQLFVDELANDARRRRIIMSCRQAGKSNALAELAKQAKREPSCVTFKITDPNTVKALERATGDSCADVPCPWGKEDGPEPFTPSNESQKPLVSLRPRFIANKQRITEILEAMNCCNSFDKAIPEEWMDELDDLVLSERDRLNTAAGNQP